MPELPEWQPLDQIGAVLSGGKSGGRVVGIVASKGASTSGWAEEAALTVARAWSAAGQKVMLVDGVLSEPSLHTATGVANGEGLSDATLFGASIGRVAQPVEEGSFFLVTAGTVVADENAVVRSRRWDQISKSSVEAGVTLGVYLRDGDAGTAAFLGSASEIVVLSGRFDAPPSAVRDLEPLVTLVTGPAGAFEAGGGREASEAPAPAVGAAVAPAGAAPVPDAGELSASVLKQTAAAGRTRLMLLVLLALVLVAAVLAAFGIVTIPGITPQAAATVVLPDLLPRSVLVPG